MDLSLKKEDCVIQLDKLNKADNYLTFNSYTSFNISEEEYNRNSTIFDLLDKNSDKCFKDVILFNSKGNNIVKMDYVLIVKDNLVLVQKCNYLGELKYKSKKEVSLTYSKNDEKLTVTRENPYLKMKKFKKQLIRYFSNLNIKIRSTQIYSVILFTNEELTYQEDKLNIEYTFSNLNNITSYLSNLKCGNKKIDLESDLPSYDKGYIENQGFFNLALVDEYFLVDDIYYPIDNFKYVVFDRESNLALLEDQNGKSIYLNLDKSKIKTNNNTNLKLSKIDFIALNQALHHSKSPTISINILINKAKKANSKFVTSTLLASLCFILSVVFLTLALISKLKFHYFLTILFACLLFLAIVFSFLNLFKNRASLKKISKISNNNLKWKENLKTEKFDMTRYIEDIKKEDNQI